MRRQTGYVIAEGDESRLHGLDEDGRMLREERDSADHIVAERLCDTVSGQTRRR